MSDVCVIAIGAVSALGIGAEAYRAAVLGEPAKTAITRDPELVAAGLQRPFVARAPMDLGGNATDDRAFSLFSNALNQVTEVLDTDRPNWRRSRVGVAIGSSSGGMLTAMRFFEARAQAKGPDVLADLARGATYFAPLSRALVAANLGNATRTTQILAACSASTIAIGLGMRWLERGVCDLVLAGGYDGVSVFVAAGFEALRATTASSPKPFRRGRDGMSLGEGAGVLALVRPSDVSRSRVAFRLAGFGASTDAVHITAPDRTGSGLKRAGVAALVDAGWSPGSVGVVSAHATATPFNDAMESKAIAAIFDGFPAPVVHPFKAQIGHTLGAAGVLEALAAVDAVSRSIAPAAAGQGEPDPEAPVRLLDRSESLLPTGVLKLSAAFGGANAALALSPTASGKTRSGTRPVYASQHVHITAVELDGLSALTGSPKDRLARLDSLCRLGLAAVAQLAALLGRERLHGAGIVAGHALATLDTNEVFDARRRARGATMVEPRLFPATSPNAIAGECAILYQLTGPSFATGAGLDGATEGLLAAAEFIAAGDAEKVVVLAADDAGPTSHALLEAAGWSHRPFARGAVALLLSAEAEGSTRQIDLDRVVDHENSPIGHLSLLRWLSEGA